ncbi:anoctamin-7-like isoform X2 [Gambusia affinis]|uniref:anoctamin-7-like isoform X2 n=1 Tax=Gambusia affinis TaxID=33528 RepID=UPI001CDC5B68|nr:anoctamin-7-like isoform X2 [Gambusia affinis]
MDSSEKRKDSSTLIGMETTSEINYGSITKKAATWDRNVFSNGKTRIDFVLVWEELRGANENGPGDGAIQRKWREQFLSRLKQRVVSQIRRKIHFILLSAPWRILCYYAEEISLRAPLQVVTIPITNWSEHFLSKLSLPSPLSQDVPNPPPDYYTCQFRANKLERFLGSDNKETFFKTTQRHKVLYEILARTPYGCVNRGEVGIDRLISEAVFTAAYPLHEGGYRMPDEPVPPESLGPRQILNEYWSKWSCWRRYQPLDHIREYFGEKIALYFAWIGFYTAWLLPASLIGTVIFLLGFVLVISDVPAKELCESKDTFIMCPLCDICAPWNYSSICFTYKAGLLFDNWGTVFLSFFMSLWAVTFLEYWKRTCSYLSHRWDCTDLEDIEERPRPEFSAMAPMTTRNPITGAEEPYFPENKRFNRTMTGCMVIILMVAVVLMFLIAIILYRTIISVVIYKSAIYKSARTNTFFGISAVTIASLSGSVLNLLVILMLSRIYTTLADFLTRWEMHRTQTKYEDMFILKVFIFQFVNFYSTPVYIAFFKGRFVGYPGMYNTLFGIRNEACGVGGCLIDLAQELLIIMVGKQIINNIEEFVSPKVKVWWQKNKLQPLLTNKTGEGTQTMMKVSPWEADYDLLVCEGLFGEYLEMVLQFGFITIFVAACPLAPLFALMNNWVEIRLDAQKFVTQYRRPVVERAQDIGIWFHILQFITHIAVISNAFLIAFTSSFVPRLYYRFTRNSTLSGFVNFTLATATETHIQQGHNISCRYRGIRDEKGDYLPEFYELLVVRLSFVIVFEHVVFFINRLIDLIVPDIPEDVELKMKREHYMAKQALAENKALGKTSIPNEKDIVLGDIQHHGSRGLLQWNDRRPTTVKKVTEKRNSSKQLEARLHQN